MTDICRVRDHRITITIGKRLLKFATENHPHFWDGETRKEQPCVKIDDIEVFMAEVVLEINAEREDGSTLLTDMLDAAIQNAVENGCEGIDHYYQPKHDDDCSCDRCEANP